MSFNLDELKSQLEDTGLLEGVTDESLIRFQLMVERAIEIKTAALQASLDEKTAEIDFITEQADAYASKIVSAISNEYGDVDNLLEKAQAYGDYCADESVKELSEKVEGYAQYVVEQFIKENQSKFVEHTEYSKMKAVFESVKSAFEANMFPLVESNSVVDTLQEKLDKASAEYKTLFNENVKLKDYAKYVERQIILDEACSDLALTQKEKIDKLTESFSDVTQFKQAVQVLVEDYKKKPTLTETKKTPELEKPALDDSVAKYAAYMKSVK